LSLFLWSTQQRLLDLAGPIKKKKPSLLNKFPDRVDNVVWSEL